MTEKSALAILGLLFSESNEVYLPEVRTLNEAECYEIYDIRNYLLGVKLPYKLVAKIITGDIKYFYHRNCWYDEKSVCSSEYDYIGIDENGRVGVWCEVDGFIAWLDEYKKKWWLEDDLKTSS